MMEMIKNILRATEEEALEMRIPEVAFDGDDVAVSEVIIACLYILSVLYMFRFRKYFAFSPFVSHSVFHILCTYFTLYISI